MTTTNAVRRIDLIGEGISSNAIGAPVHLARSLVGAARLSIHVAGSAGAVRVRVLTLPIRDQLIGCAVAAGHLNPDRPGATRAGW
jgi:hypothetical protein